MRKKCQSRTLNKFSIKNANYKAINKKLSERVLALQNMKSNTPEDEENLVTAYQKDTLINTCENHLTKVKLTDKYTPWWNPELTQVRKEMTKRRKKAQTAVPAELNWFI